MEINTWGSGGPVTAVGPFLSNKSMANGIQETHTNAKVWETRPFLSLDQRWPCRLNLLNRYLLGSVCFIVIKYICTNSSLLTIFQCITGTNHFIDLCSQLRGIFNILKITADT